VRKGHPSSEVKVKVNVIVELKVVENGLNGDLENYVKGHPRSKVKVMVDIILKFQGISTRVRW